MKQIGFTVYNLNLDPADKAGLVYEIRSPDGTVKDRAFIKSSRVVEIQPGDQLVIQEGTPTDAVI